MSAEGKKIAVELAKHEVITSFLAALSKIHAMALPSWLTIAQATSVSAIAQGHILSVINTPSERFNDDGTVKPYEPIEGVFIVGVKK